MAMFSFSNGYLGNLCMMMGPKTSDVSFSYCPALVVQHLCLGHGGAGEDSDHDGGGPGPGHRARLLPLLSCSQLALVEFTTFDVID